MAFWQYGLQGQNAFPTSGSVSYPYSTQANINNCRVVATFALNTNTPIGQSYRVLLNTFSLGTQLIFDITPMQQTYNVTIGGQAGQDVDGVSHSIQGKLRAKGGAEINLGTSGNINAFGYITDNRVSETFSIYYQNYLTATINDPLAPAKCFPLDGAGGATNVSIAMVSNSGGCDFYVVGFPSYYDISNVKYNYTAPAYYMFSISNEYLENPALFDPNQDKFNADEGVDGPGGGVDGLPTAPSYPGTDVDFPSLPSGASAFDFTTLRLFKPTAANLASALDILYSDDTESTLETIIESCKKWWYKPDQYCIALMLSPVNASTTTSRNIKFGKYDSEVSAPCVDSQWQIVDLGTVTIPLKYGSYLDFNPHANAKIFLPFIGIRSINLNEIMGATLACKYYVDMLTGSALCMVKASKPSSNSIVTYTYECNVAFQVPLTANNYNQVITSLISAGLSAGSQNYGAMAANIAQAASSLGSPSLTESGKLTSNSGVMGEFTPYVILEFPVPSTPNRYQEYRGIPSDSYVSLGSVHGFTVVNYVHLDIPDATDEETAEIESMLKSGVIF